MTSIPSLTTSTLSTLSSRIDDDLSSSSSSLTPTSCDKIPKLSSISETSSFSEKDLDSFSRIGQKRRATGHFEALHKANTASKVGSLMTKTKDVTRDVIKTSSLDGLGVKRRAIDKKIDLRDSKIKPTSKAASLMTKEKDGIQTTSLEGLGLKRHKSTYNRIGVKKDTFSKESARFLSFTSEIGKKRKATTVTRKNVKRNTFFKEIPLEDLQLKDTLFKIDRLLWKLQLEDETKKFTL